MLRKELPEVQVAKGGGRGEVDDENVGAAKVIDPHLQVKGDRTSKDHIRGKNRSGNWSKAFGLVYIKSTLA